MPRRVHRRGLRTDGRELGWFLKVGRAGNDGAGVTGKGNIRATGTNLHGDPGARTDGVPDDAELVDVPGKDDFGRAAVVGKFIAFNPQPVAAFEERFAQQKAGFAVVSNLVLPDQVVSIAFAHGDAGPAVVPEEVVLANRILRAQAIEDAAAGIVFADVVGHDVPDRTAPGVQAGAFVVMQMTAADENIGALLEADGIAVVIGDRNVLDDSPVDSEQNDPAAPTAVNPKLLLRIAVERQATNGNIGDIVAADQRESAPHPRARRRRVVVREGAIDEEVGALATNNRRNGFVEPERVLVAKGDAHADLELAGFFDLKLKLSIADPREQCAADARDFLENRAGLADKVDAATQVQRVIHPIGTGGNLDDATAFASRFVDEGLESDGSFHGVYRGCRTRVRFAGHRWYRAHSHRRRGR